MVYETFLNDLPGIGSVCSGGRYDNLAGLYMKDRIPGVGSSIGLDRLIAALDELGRSVTKPSFTQAAVFCQREADMALYQKAASELRSRGVACEVYPDPKKMGQQYAWAEKKGIPWGVTLTRADSAASGALSGLTLKNLVTRETLENQTVITSYSIHYTKLYEGRPATSSTPPGRPGPTAPNSRSCTPTRYSTPKRGSCNCPAAPSGSMTDSGNWSCRPIFTPTWPRIAPNGACSFSVRPLA